MNTKKIKISIPDEIALKQVKTVPTFKDLSRLDLKVGDNFETVGHVLFSNMKRLYPLIRITIEEIK